MTQIAYNIGTQGQMMTLTSREIQGGITHTRYPPDVVPLMVTDGGETKVYLVSAAIDDT